MLRPSNHVIVTANHADRSFLTRLHVGNARAARQRVQAGAGPPGRRRSNAIVGLIALPKTQELERAVRHVKLDRDLGVDGGERYFLDASSSETTPTTSPAWVEARELSVRASHEAMWVL
jgi:hypothetical protein